MSETAQSPRVIRVLVCEDAPGQQSIFSTFVAGEFDGSLLEQFGDVATSMADTVVRSQRSPDIVLIDDHIAAAPNGPKDHYGVETAMRIALAHQRAGRARYPRLVLWTTAPDPVLCAGFCIMGHNILGKDAGLADARRLLVDTFNGATWTDHSVERLEGVGLPKGDLRALPHLEAGDTSKATGAAHGLSEHTVERIRLRLGRAFQIKEGDRAVQIPAAAKKAGIGWQSLEHQALLKRLAQEYGLPNPVPA